MKNPGTLTLRISALMAAAFVLLITCTAQEGTPVATSQPGDASLRELDSQVRELRAVIEQIRAENAESRAEMRASRRR